MKFLAFTSVIILLFVQSIKSQDSLLNQNHAVQKARIYKAYIFNTDRHPAKGYLITIQDSAVFLSPYNVKMPLNFINADIFHLQKFEYSSIRKMKVFSPHRIGTSILIGAVAGVIAGALIGYAGGDDSGWFGLTAGGKALVGGVLGGSIGTVVGVIAGNASTKEFLIDGEWKSLQEVKETYQNK